MVHGQNVKYINVTPPAAILDNTSASTTEVDTLGFDYLTYVVCLGATDIAMTALAATESDTSGSGHANITGAVYGTSTNTAGSTSTLPSATDDNKVFLIELDLRSRKRYIDLTATMGNGTNGGYVSVVAILSRAKTGINSATDAGASQVLRV